MGPSLVTHIGALQDEGWLKEYWLLLRRRRSLIVSVFLAVLTLAAVRTFVTRPVYEGVAKLLIERENPNVLTFKEVAEVDSARDDYYQTQYKLLQSRALVRNVIVDMGLLGDPEFGGPRSAKDVEAILAKPPGESPVMESAIDTFLSRLRVQPDKNSRLVNVAFEALRPELAAQAANSVARLYIQQTLEFRYQTSAEAGQWLGTQIKDQRAKVEAAEVALQKFKEQEGIVNIEERRTLLDQKLKELGTAVTTIKTQRLEKEALHRQMREATSPEELPDVLRNPVIQGLRIELAGLERKDAQLAQRYLDEHPEVLQVRKQIQDTRARIADEAQRVVRAAENDYKAAVAQEGSLVAALEAAKSEALELSARGVQYDSLKRELLAAKGVLDSILSRSKETDVARELKASNIRIVDPAVVPRIPVRPNLRRDLLLGLLFGLGLSLGLALFLDHLDNTVKTPEDVRHHLGVPMLGVIPETESSDKGADLILLNTKRQGPFVEGYRTLRTALSYSWPDQACRVVLVTSAGPEEGKTLTSVNLALTLASLESRVLLIDCDLRKPQTHVHLDFPRTPGLSDVIVGRAEVSEAIHRVGETRLFILPAGTHVPSPGDLLTVSSLKRLFDSLRSRYDWIVVDTPPVGAVADPLILAPLADGVAVVTAAEMVPRGAVRDALHRIAETGARTLGILLNRARIERYAYYYGTYYGAYYSEHHEQDKSPALIRRAAR
jgi:capsular exopolysaccharide synthesis family protein